MADVNENLKITLDDSDRDLFMSYGLLNELTAIVPDIDQIGSTIVDREIRAKLFDLVLVPRDAKGKPTEAAFSALDHSFSVGDSILILDWAQGHLVNFFVRAGTSLKARVDVAVAALYPSTPSSNGTGA